MNIPKVMKQYTYNNQGYICDTIIICTCMKATSSTCKPIDDKLTIIN